MKTFAEKKQSHSSAETAPSKTAESRPNPHGIEMMRQLLNRGTIAAQLKIGSPSDPSEIQADRVADAVVNDTGNTIPPGENRSAISPKKTADSGTSAALPRSFINSGTPRPLNTTEKDYFEQRFDQNFSDIRIHEGNDASQAASAINARAFAHGSDIYLKHGEYSFGTTDGKRLMAHELAHTRQPDNGSIRRWGGDEHMAFGNIAGGMIAKKYGAYMNALLTLTGLANSDSGEKSRVMQTSALQLSGKRTIKGREKKVRKGNEDKAYTQSMYVPYKHVYPLAEYDKQMLLGTGTELSGDHRESAEDLAASSHDQSRLTDYAFGDYNPKYLVLASTNYNHFFPLAVKEWQRNHEMATITAFFANMMFRMAATDPKNRFDSIASGNRLLKKAIQYEVFGLHFLQDAFASGHQYPRAFDLTQPTEFYMVRYTSGRGSGFEHRTVHSFDKVTQMKRRGWRLTGGGDKSTGHKARIYHDLLCELEKGIHLKHRGDSRRFHGDGTGDSTDYPVAVETYNSLAEVFCIAFSAEMKDVDAQEPKAPTGPDIPKIMADDYAAPIWFAMETDLKNNFDANSGNPDTDKKNETDSGMVSFTHDAVMQDWKKIHTDGKFVTETHKDKQPEGADFYIEGVGDPTLLFTEQDDHIVKYLKTKPYPSTIAPNQSAYIINILIDGVCGDEDEAAILKIINAQSDADCLKVFNKVTMEKFDSGIDGQEWDEFLSLIMSKLPAEKNAGAWQIAQEENDDAARRAVDRLWPRGYTVIIDHVSPQACIGLIKALLSGSCGDDDEDAIVKIVRYLVEGLDEKDMINAWIGKDTMDSGVDGSQWREVAELMEWD